VKIYVAAVEALRKKERQSETQETIFPEFSPTPLLNANVFFLQVFKNLTPCMTKLGVLVLSFHDFTDIANINGFWDFQHCTNGVLVHASHKGDKQI